METINSIYTSIHMTLNKNFIQYTILYLYLSYKIKILFIFLLSFILYIAYKHYYQLARNFLQTVNNDKYYEMIWKTLISSPLTSLANLIFPFYLYFFPYSNIAVLFVQTFLNIIIRLKDFKAIYDHIDTKKFDLKTSKFYLNYAESVLIQNESDENMLINPLERLININIKKKQREKGDMDISLNNKDSSGESNTGSEKSIGKNNNYDKNSIMKKFNKINQITNLNMNSTILQEDDNYDQTSKNISKYNGYKDIKDLDINNFDDGLDTMSDYLQKYHSISGDKKNNIDKQFNYKEHSDYYTKNTNINASDNAKNNFYEINYFSFNNEDLKRLHTKNNNNEINNLHNFNSDRNNYNQQQENLYMKDIKDKKSNSFQNLNNSIRVNPSNSYVENREHNNNTNDISRKSDNKKINKVSYEDEVLKQNSNIHFAMLTLIGLDLIYILLVSFPICYVGNMTNFEDIWYYNNQDQEYASNEFNHKSSIKNDKESKLLNEYYNSNYNDKTPETTDIKKEYDIDYVIKNNISYFYNENNKERMMNDNFSFNNTFKEEIISDNHNSKGSGKRQTIYINSNNNHYKAVNDFSDVDDNSNKSQNLYYNENNSKDKIKHGDIGSRENRVKSNSNINIFNTKQRSIRFTDYCEYTSFISNNKSFLNKNDSKVMKLFSQILICLVSYPISLGAIYFFQEFKNSSKYNFKYQYNLSLLHYHDKKTDSSNSKYKSCNNNTKESLINNNTQSDNHFLIILITDLFQIFQYFVSLLKLIISPIIKIITPILIKILNILLKLLNEKINKNDITITLVTMVIINLLIYNSIVIVIKTFFYIENMIIFFLYCLIYGKKVSMQLFEKTSYIYFNSHIDYSFSHFIDDIKQEFFLDLSTLVYVFLLNLIFSFIILGSLFLSSFFEAVFLKINNFDKEEFKIHDNNSAITNINEIFDFIYNTQKCYAEINNENNGVNLSNSSKSNNNLNIIENDDNNSVLNNEYKTSIKKSYSNKRKSIMSFTHRNLKSGPNSISKDNKGKKYNKQTSFIGSMIIDHSSINISNPSYGNFEEISVYDKLRLIWITFPNVFNRNNFNIFYFSFSMILINIFNVTIEGLLCSNK